MKPFTYERAASPAARRVRGGACSRSEVHRGRNEPARPDEDRHRGAGAPDRRQWPGPRQDRADRRGRAATRRHGPQHRPGSRCEDQARLSPALASLARRRLRPVAQQGHHGRQPAPAHALPLLLRHQPGLQQTLARQRLRGNRRLQPAARDRGREQVVHRRAPERHGRGHACARCHGGNRASGRRHAAHSHR